MFWLSHKPNRKRVRRRAENKRVSRKRVREEDPHVHILDVQTFSSKELKIKRATQFRRLILSVSLLLSVVAFFATSRILLKKWLFENPELMLSRLEVQTDGILRTATILREAKIEKFAPILSVDLSDARENLLKLPQVKDVAIERTFPDTLKIDVEERFAIAWLGCEYPRIEPLRDGVMIDEDGVPFVISENRNIDFKRLPVLSVKRIQKLETGIVVDDEQIKAGLDLLFLSRQALYDLDLEIMAIDAPNPYSLVAKYNNRAIVTFGLNDLNGQIERLRSAIVHAKSLNKTIASINLLMSRNTPVTFFEGETREAEPTASSIYAEIDHGITRDFVGERVNSTFPGNGDFNDEVAAGEEESDQQPAANAGLAGRPRNQFDQIRDILGN